MFIDGHNDTIKKLYLANASFVSNNKNTLCMDKCVMAGYNCGIFSIHVPAENIEHRKPGYGLKVSKNGWKVEYPVGVSQQFAETFTNDVIEYLKKDIANSVNMHIVKSIEELMFNLHNPQIVNIILHFEGAEPIKQDLSNLVDYYQKGLRSLGIVWSRQNVFGQGVPFEYPGHPDHGIGLTHEGKCLVKRCNELGILIDLAHINQKGFFDVANISNKPLVVSHAGVHAICPTTTNLTDEQLLAIKNSNGVAGVLFDVLNTRKDGKYDLDTSISVIVEHIAYMVDFMGIDHVAIGSDYDGAIIPNCLKNPASIYLIMNALHELGYSQKDIEKIAYRNWLRVFMATWEE